MSPSVRGLLGAVAMGCVPPMVLDGQTPDTAKPYTLGGGNARVTVSRLDYEGERDHSAADQRVLNARLNLSLATGWSLAVVAAGISRE